MGWFRIHKIYNPLYMWEQFWGFRLDSIKWGDLYWHPYWSTGGTPRLMSNGGWFHPQLRALKVYVNRYQGHGIEMIYTTTEIRGSHRTALLISWLLTHMLFVCLRPCVCVILCAFSGKYHHIIECQNCLFQNKRPKTTFRVKYNYL